MSDKKQHGGKRKGAGRKPAPFPKQTIVINCTDKEKRQILEVIESPRQRAKILLDWIENEPSKPHIIY